MRKKNDSPVLQMSVRMNVEEELVKPGTTIGTKFSVLQTIRIPSLMRCGFLTIDPFVGMPDLIAKLSKRQCCWHVIEDFKVKNIFNSLTNTIASSCVYTTSSKYPFQLYSGPFC